ncbi:MAG: proline--tRNA ligase [Candidatus Aenigmarchaeota archaeon]|nr:proline--tRNA ligase [Candidatus Aenigmarchaeota archaeon]
MSEQEKLPEKEKNFSEWYHELIRRTLIDQRYPFQGFLVYRPLGAEMFSRAINILEELLRERRHQKVYFPSLIPEKLLKKEEHHIMGVAHEVFWVTNAGKTNLEEPAALRPTSETAMYEMLRYWIRSWRDLPLKIFQSCSVFRYETKHTRPLIRDREILWNEAHTSHASMEEAEEQIKEGIEIYTKLYEKLAIPHIWIDVITGVFAGAESAKEAYTIFPDGRMLEMGSVNNLGQRFSRAFDIKFKTRDEKEDYVYQTCYGVSERILSAIVAVHGDNFGLVIPPEIAPIQIVLIPIFYKEDREEVLKETYKLKEKISKETEYRIVLDDNEEQTPGEKFYKWELYGVPLRIELGKKDIEKGGITIVRRDIKKKEFVENKKIIEKIKFLFEDITRNMQKRAKEYHESKIVFAKKIENIPKVINENKVAKIVWCGDIECASKIEKQVNSVFVGKAIDEKADGSCIWCGKTGKFYGYVGKTY